MHTANNIGGNIGSDYLGKHINGLGGVKVSDLIDTFPVPGITDNQPLVPWRRPGILRASYHS